MLQILLRKWWMVLIQGIVLILLSICIFNNPVEVLAGISVWLGILIVASGVLGIVRWLAEDNNDRESFSFLWSLVTTFFGLFILFNLLATIKVLTIIFGMWMLLTGLHLGQSGWSMKKNHPVGWVMIVIGVLSVATGIIMTFNITMGAKGISILLGLQVLLTGLALVLFAFAKKVVINNINDKMTALKSKMQR